MHVQLLSSHYIVHTVIVILNVVQLSSVIKFDIAKSNYPNVNAVLYKRHFSKQTVRLVILGNVQH